MCTNLYFVNRRCLEWFCVWRHYIHKKQSLIYSGIYPGGFMGQNFHLKSGRERKMPVIQKMEFSYIYWSNILKSNYWWVFENCFHLALLHIFSNFKSKIENAYLCLARWRNRHKGRKRKRESERIWGEKVRHKNVRYFYLCHILKNSRESNFRNVSLNLY